MTVLARLFPYSTPPAFIQVSFAGSSYIPGCSSFTSNLSEEKLMKNSPRFQRFQGPETEDRLQFMFSLITIFWIRPVPWHILLSLIMLASHSTFLDSNEADIAVTIYPAQLTALRLYWPELRSSEFTTLFHSVTPSNKEILAVCPHSLTSVHLFRRFTP